MYTIYELVSCAVSSISERARGAYNSPGATDQEVGEEILALLPKLRTTKKC